MISYRVWWRMVERPTLNGYRDSHKFQTEKTRVLYGGWFLFSFIPLYTTVISMKTEVYLGEWDNSIHLEIQSE